MIGPGLVQLVISPPVRHRSRRVASVFVVGSKWLEEASVLLPLLPRGASIAAYDLDVIRQPPWYGTVRRLA